jgi:hypothetical protein
LFFAPNNQGNTRLNLSVTKPLRAGAGKVYNERLIIQARIDSRISLQQARQDIQQNSGSDDGYLLESYIKRAAMCFSNAIC